MTGSANRSNVKDCFRGTIWDRERQAPRASISLNPADIRRGNNNCRAFRNNSQAPLRRRTRYVVKRVDIFFFFERAKRTIPPGAAAERKVRTIIFLDEKPSTADFRSDRTLAHLEKHKLHASSSHKLQLSASLFSWDCYVYFLTPSRRHQFSYYSSQ